MESNRLSIENDSDLNQLRGTLRRLAEGKNFSEYDATKLVTASSEIARNILDYAGEGQVHIETLEEDQCSIQVVFEDEGPGIPDVTRALEDGFSGENSDGLGVGLPGAKRLADEFEIESTQGRGTLITLLVRPEARD